MLAPALLTLLATPTDDPPVRTFTSPSGAWILTVTRPEKTWNGAVELVLTHDGVEAWRARHELGLREACVGNDGRVAGYGYTGEGRAEHASHPDSPRGEVLRIFVLHEDGELLVDESHARERYSRYPDGPHAPVAAGAFMTSDRFVVRIHDEDIDRGAESWWSYDMDTGAPLPTVRPKLSLEQEGGLLGAAGIPATPLALLHWASTSRGSRFQLVDGDLRAVWTLEVPQDLESYRSEDWYELRERKRGNVHSTSDHAFELRLVGDAAIVRYAIERGTDGWSVIETGREPDPKAKPNPRPR